MGGDLVRHAYAGVDPARSEPLQRAEAPERLLVAHDRHPAETRRDHAVEIGADAVGEIDERGPLPAEEGAKGAGARAEDGLEVRHARHRSRDRAFPRRAGPPGERRQDVDGRAVDGDRLRLEERQRGRETRAVEVRDQVEDAGERAADHAAGARLDEQDAARRHRFRAPGRGDAMGATPHPPSTTSPRSVARSASSSVKYPCTTGTTCSLDWHPRQGVIGVKIPRCASRRPRMFAWLPAAVRTAAGTTPGSSTSPVLESFK